MKCHLCGKHVLEIGGYLERVNPKGVVPAVWECRPNCSAGLPQETRVMLAIGGEPEEPTR